MPRLALLKKAVASATAFFVVSLVVHPAGAQTEGVGVTVTPARIESDGNGEIAHVVTVSNGKVEPVVVDVALGSVTHDLEGTVEFPAPPPRVAASVRITGGGRITLGPKQRHEVRVAGSIPTDGVPSLYPAVVVTLPQSGETGNVNVVNRLAVPLLLRGPKPWSETLEIGEILIRGARGGTRIEATVNNTGNVHIRPTGTITVRRGDEVLREAALPTEAILPGLGRYLGVGWDVPGNFQDGPVEVIVRVDTPQQAERRVTLNFDRDEVAEQQRRAEARGPSGPSVFPGTTIPPEVGEPVLGSLPGIIATGISILLLLLLAGWLLWFLLKRRKRKKVHEEERGG